MEEIRPDNIHKYNESVNNLLKIINTELTFRTAKLVGYNISYVEAGAGEPLILIHGINIGWGQWYPNFSALAKRYKVYAINLPGASDSTPIDVSRSGTGGELVKVLEEFIKFKAISNFIIVGHSLGAWVVIKLALLNQHLIRKMILISPLGFNVATPLNQFLLGFKPLQKFLSRTVMKATVTNIRKFLSGVVYDPSVIKSEFVDYYTQVVNLSKNNHPFSFINMIIRPFKVKQEFILTASEIHSFSWPMLIIVGKHDKIVNWEKVEPEKKRFLSQCVEVFDNSGHVPAMEESSRFNTRALEFINEER